MMGSVIAAFEAWLLIRGLRTLYVRYERASASALAVARRLAVHTRGRAGALPRPARTTPATPSRRGR